MLAGVTLTGSSGDDFIEIGLSANFQNVIGKLNNFEVFNVPDSSIDTIVINALGGSDSIFVDEPGDNTTNVTGAAGNDTLFISDLAKDILNTFAGCTVTFDGGADSNSIVLANATDNVTHTFESGSYTLNPTEVTVTWTSVSNVTLHGGTGGENIELRGGSAGTALILNGNDGADEFTIGEGGNVENVQGNATINGGDGDDLLFYDDSSNTFDDFYFLTADTVARDFSAVITYGDISEMELRTASASNTVNVLTTGATTFYDIYDTSGADTFNLGDEDNVEEVKGQIAFIGSDDDDVMNYNDSANNFSDTYTLGVNTITRDFSGIVFYYDMAELNVFAGDGPNQINVDASVPAATALSIDAGDGTDTIGIVGSEAADIVSFGPSFISASDAFSHVGAEQFSFTSGGGTDSLTVDGVTVSLTESARLSSLLFTVGNGPSTLDMRDHDMVLDYSDERPIGEWLGSSYGGYTGAIASGYNGGSWDGSGIITSLSNIDDGTLRTVGIGESSFVLGLSESDTDVWNGMTVDGTCVLIKYTYMGDIDLSGELNGDDYFWLDSNVLQNGTVFGYSVGDIDLTGEMNGDDYFWLDSNILAAQIVGPI